MSVSLSFKILCAIAVSLASANSLATFDLPTVDYNDLASRNPAVGKSVLDTLTTLGALQIVGIPEFAAARKDALDKLATCLAKDKDAPVVTMPDGSKRLSTGAASKRGVGGMMSSKCGDDSVYLRYLVDTASEKLFESLDLNQVATDKQLLMQPAYHNLQELMSQGEHLEHMHSYYNTAEGTVKVNGKAAPTMDMHVDSGLMIAMTTGYFTNSAASEDSGLYMQLPGDLSQVKLNLRDDGLVVMMGSGASEWLAPIYGKSFRAVPHAMVADLSVQGTAAHAARSWYGKMYLPPADAVVPQANVPYGDYHAKLASASKKIFTGVPAACANEEYPTRSFGGVDSQKAIATTSSMRGGYVATAGFDVLTTSTTCTITGTNTTGLMCWMQCYSVSGLSCGLNALCTNPSTGATNSGTGMCHGTGGAACTLQCPTAQPSLQPTTSVPTFTPTRAPTDFSSELHGDQIAGVVIGVFFGCLLIAVLLYVCNMVLVAKHAATAGEGVNNVAKYQSVELTNPSAEQPQQQVITEPAPASTSV